MSPSPKESSTEVIKREFNQLQKQIKPILMKSLLYAIFSAPLFSFSFVSILYLLGLEGNENILLPLVIFSIIGAFSIALFHEALHKNKVIKDTSKEYIKKRIGESPHLDLPFKETYLKKIDEKPRNMYQIFVVFLEHEYRIRIVKDKSEEES